MTRKKRLEKIIEIFRAEMPSPETELNYKTPYQLAVAVILSAQCTDVRVNKITPDFYKAFPEAKDLAAAEEVDIFEYIKSCSYPNSKTKNLRNMAIKLVNDFNSVFPEDPDDMQKLPGVGRKTAHVLASVLYGQNVLAVDTHVHRVSVRIGLTPKAKNPVQVERGLVEIAPEDILHHLHHWLILHGRYTCKARTPQCAKCKITEYCSYFAKEQKKIKTPKK